MKNKLGVLAMLVVSSFVLLVGCGSKPSAEVQEIIEKIVQKESSIDEQNYTETDFSFKIYYSELLDKYAISALVPYNGEANKQEYKFFYNMNELTRDGSTSNLPSILTEGGYEKVYISGKYLE